MSQILSLQNLLNFMKIYIEVLILKLVKLKMKMISNKLNLNIYEIF